MASDFLDLRANQQESVATGAGATGRCPPAILDIKVMALGRARGRLRLYPFYRFVKVVEAFNSIQAIYRVKKFYISSEKLDGASIGFTGKNTFKNH